MIETMNHDLITAIFARAKPLQEIFTTIERFTQMEIRDGENTEAPDSKGLAKPNLLPRRLERLRMNIVDTDNYFAHL
jgi:hypothetical protein